MIEYIDRTSGQKKIEQIYGEKALKFLYNSHAFCRFLLTFVAKTPLFSSLYGWWQHQSWTKRKIAPFLEKYSIAASEFLKTPEEFSSFDDFFIRRLKKEARPLAPETAIIPADGRFLFYPDIAKSASFIVKGNKFALEELLQNHAQAARYAEGSLVLGRLNPTDYHRFHFPCNCTPSSPRLINGALFSVNPLALKKNISRLTENKRMVTELKTLDFGTVLFIEIGATNVGSIHQTFTPGKTYAKGEEKGYFSFGGSALILLFEPQKITFASDLLSVDQLEILCKMGQPLSREV